MPTGVYVRSQATKDRLREIMRGNTRATGYKFSTAQIATRSSHPTWKSDSFRDKVRASSTGRVFSEESRAKIAEKLRGNSNGSGKPPRSEESRHKMRVARSLFVVPCKDSKPEIAVQERLTALGIEFEKHKTLPQILNRKVRLHQFDILIESSRTAIEIDGCYWHACPQCRERQCKPRDWTPIAERDAMIVSEAVLVGWRVIRLWEHDIKAQNFATIDCLKIEKNKGELQKHG